MPEKEPPPRLSATLCLGPTLAPFIADGLMYGIMSQGGGRERERGGRDEVATEMAELSKAEYEQCECIL